MRENTEFKEVKGVGRIPVDWEVRELSELIEECRSGLSRQIQSQDIGIPVMISGNIQDGKLNTSELKYWYRKDPQGSDVDNYILKDRDILLCFINSLQQIGKLCLYKNIGREAIYTTNLFRIRSDDKVSPEFLYYLLSGKCVQNEIINITKPAVNQASFTKGDFLGIRVPYIPLKEQEKIAQVLSNVDMNIEKTEQAIYKYKQVKKGLMDDLLTGKVRIKDGKRFKETRFKEVKGVGKIPWDWEVIALDKLSSKIGDGLHGTPQYTDDGNYYFVNGNNLENKKIVTNSSTKKVDDIEFNKYKKDLTNNTILISLNGTIGSLAFYNNEDIVLGKSAGYVTLKNNIDKEFIYYQLDSNRINDYFIKELTGTTIKNLSLQTLRNSKIVIPKTDEIKYITKTLTNSDNIIEKEEKYLKKLKKLKLAFMEDLLTGKVRVKID